MIKENGVVSFLLLLLAIALFAITLTASQHLVETKKRVQAFIAALSRS
jgi:hypothetical protein